MKESEATMILKNEMPGCGEKIIFAEGEKCEAYEMAIQALEKQIPKRPIKSKEQRIRYVNTYYCPTCNLSFTGFNIAKWCYHCGQKLDWSDKESEETKL